MPAPARVEYVAKKKAERDATVSEINKLAKARNAYLKGRGPADSFDAKVQSAVKRQAADELGLGF
jgi:hypothetical protein